MASGGSIDRYRHIREIARGGMGRVSEVVDEYLHRRVALKEIIGTDEATRARFAREVEITARLEHPSIIPLYDAGISEVGLPFYVMRQVTGRPLYDLIVAAGSLDQRLRLVPHLLAVADAVAHAHQRGIIHRDLKPTNVLVGELGETVVIDWGLAKVLGEVDPLLPATASHDDGLTAHGSVMGTPGFMAPEQLRGEEVDARADVYALGACLYNLLSGRLPPGPTPPTVYRGGDAPLPPKRVPLAEAAPGVPPELVTIATRAMAEARDARYEDAGGVAEDLRHFLGGRLVASHRYALTTRIRRWLRRRAVMAIAVLAGIAIAVIGTVAIRNVIEARHAAETALDGERRRAEELVVTQAASYLESNPTLAAATLTQLPAGSPNWARAFSIAAQARASGVAVAFPGGGERVVLHYGPDHRVASVTESGVWLLDLDRRTARRLETDGAWQAAWATRRLVLFRADAVSVIDPVTGARVSLPSPGHVQAWHVGGEVIAALLEGGELRVLELGSQTWSAIAREVTRLEIAPTGDWLVLERATAGELLHRKGGTWESVRTGAFEVVGAAFDERGHRLAIQVDGRARELDLEHGAVELRQLAPDVNALRYVGAALYTTGRADPRLSFHPVDGEPSIELDPFPVAASGAVANLFDKREIVVKTGAIRATIRAPGQVSVIAGRSDSPHLVGYGPEYIYAWDLRDIIGSSWTGPHGSQLVAAGPARVAIVGDDPPPTPVWQLSLTGERERVAELTGPLPQLMRFGEQLAATSPGDRGLLLIPQGERVNSAALASDGPEAIVVASEGRVERRTRSGERRELVTMTAPVIEVGARASTYVVIDRDRHVWRRLADGREQRATLAAGSVLVGMHDDGTAVLAAANTVYTWRPDDPVPMQRAMLDEPVVAACLHDRAVVAITRTAAYRIAADGARTPLIPGSRVVIASRDCARVAALADTAVVVADVDTATTWQVATTSRNAMLALLDDGHALVIGNGRSGSYQTVMLPARSDVQAWVQTATNALPPEVGRAAVVFRPLADR